MPVDIDAEKFYGCGGGAFCFVLRKGGKGDLETRQTMCRGDEGGRL